MKKVVVHFSRYPAHDLIFDREIDAHCYLRDHGYQIDPGNDPDPLSAICRYKSALLGRVYFYAPLSTGKGGNEE